MKVDKSLQEVWEWKEKVYADAKNLSVKEAASRIHNDAERIKKKFNLRLKRMELARR